MYTGLAIAYVGGALLAGTGWPLFTLPLALVAIRVLVIGPEERDLTRRFGQTYLDYCSRTRRRIGLPAARGSHPAIEPAAKPKASAPS